MYERKRYYHYNLIQNCGSCLLAAVYAYRVIKLNGISGLSLFLSMVAIAIFSFSLHPASTSSLMPLLSDYYKIHQQLIPVSLRIGIWSNKRLGRSFVACVLSEIDITWNNEEVRYKKNAKYLSSESLEGVLILFGFSLKSMAASRVGVSHCSSSKLNSLAGFFSCCVQ